MTQADASATVFVEATRDSGATPVTSNAAAIGTFLIQKVRPRDFCEAEQAKRATRIAATSWVVLLLLPLGMMLLSQGPTGGGP